jgi:hypothetical protein
MPGTTKALKKAMGKSGPAHRFVGLARQKQNCTGIEHSDGRNYMLSTLTPLQCAEGCGIVVDGIETPIVQGGTPVILDNTFRHHVFNHGTEDRHCLMSECWHPALTLKERDALATLFAAKDRFTVQELALAPWGFDDESLEFALRSGSVSNLDFWKDFGYDRELAKATELFKEGKLRKGSNKRKGTKKPKGFGQ